MILLVHRSINNYISPEHAEVTDTLKLKREIVIGTIFLSLSRKMTVPANNGTEYRIFMKRVTGTD